MASHSVGFEPDEIDPRLSTRDARLKWVIVVSDGLSAGRAANAAVCVAAATAASVTGLLGPDAVDAAGADHPGLPWLGCSVLTAPTETLVEIRARASSSDEVFVADMPEAAQSTRVYAEYLEAVSGLATDETGPLAISLVGPRNRIDRLVGRLALLA